jgi:mono/diheme cytochrome c family protein
MSEHNPELQPPPKPPKNEEIQPGAIDFVESPEPQPAAETHEPLPVWLYLICGLALFFSGSSFTGFGSFGLGLYDQGPGAPALTTDQKTPTAVVADDPITLGKRVYSGNCANCHQASGEGQPGSYPPMGGSEYVIGDKLRLAAIMLHGIQGPLTVKGGAYGTQQMPGWDASLDDKKISEVMTYIRKSWGNTADDISPDEITAARTKFASHSAPWTEAELLKISAK